MEAPAMGGSAVNEEDVQRVAWFVDLIHCRRKDDLQGAAEAKEALESLGIAVRFRRSGKELRRRGTG